MERNRKYGRTRQSSYSGPAEAGVVNPRAKQRALCVGVFSETHDADPLAELKELLRTAGVAVSGDLIQRRERPDANTYLGKGKIEELKRQIKASNANLVACDDELSPRQERNLEELLAVPAIDRTATILDIFADHATSAEGKLQVELAQLEYNLARMRGLWTHLERLGGGIGTRGPGETQIETDRRLARQRIERLKKKIELEKRRRSLMRKERKMAHLPTVALAGYTNAGKSTLLNAVTGASVGVGERLFHTLDPTTRTYKHRGRKYLLTDTVGFIKKLPHQLVDAFAATLEETTVADLIVQIADASEPDDEIEAKMAAVSQVLEEIGAGERPMLMAMNKIDLLHAEELQQLKNRFPKAFFISSISGEGLDELKTGIERALRAGWQRIELLLPHGEGAILHELHELAGDLVREETPAGVKVVARVPAVVASRYNLYLINGPKETQDGTDG